MRNHRRYSRSSIYGNQTSLDGRSSINGLFLHNDLFRNNGFFLDNGSPCLNSTLYHLNCSLYFHSLASADSR